MNIFLVFVTIFGLSRANISSTGDNFSHYCQRPCKNARPMECKYHFIIEHVSTLEPACESCMNTTGKCPECIIADGRKRNLIAVNRQMPGPAIHVCYGDIVTVVVSNRLYTETTAIHWHGMTMQETPWMDGVSMITQCGILPWTSFTYQFVANTIGTHFYHSHSDFQQGDGAFGPLIVHLADDTKYDNYDLPEHVIVLSEWFIKTALDQFITDERKRKRTRRIIESVLINGVGRSVKHKVLPPVFRVTKNRRYRFRLIHAGTMSCPMYFHIQGHKMLVVASDGQPIKPILIDTLVLLNGERYDFILDATAKINSYIIRVEGTIHCLFDTSYAVLEYEGSNHKTLDFEHYTPPIGLTLNCINKYKPANCLDYIDMKSELPENTALYKKPDFLGYFALNMSRFARKVVRGVDDSQSTAGVINEISMNMPTAPLLLNPNIDQEYCNFTHMESRYCQNYTHCECVHRLQFPLGKLIEMCFIDEGTATSITHPIHLHGYKFIVIAYKKLYTNTTRDAVIAMDERGELKRNFKTPIYKDSVSVPDGGYICVRFIANNPGVWLLHCHTDTHMNTGMQMVLQIDPQPELPNGFPNCGNYVPLPNLSKKVKDF